MSLASATAAPITRTIDAESITFKRLTLGDMGVLAERLYAVQQADTERYLKMLLATGLKPDQLPMLIRELDRRPAYTEVRRWVFTTPGAVEVLAIASGQAADAIKAWTDHETCHDLVLDLIGLGNEGGADGSVPLSANSTAIGTGTPSSPFTADGSGATH